MNNALEYMMTVCWFIKDLFTKKEVCQICGKRYIRKHNFYLNQDDPDRLCELCFEDIYIAEDM